MVEEGTSIAQASLVAEELEPTGRMQLLEVLEEAPPEQLGEHANRQQEVWRGTRPNARC